MKYEKLRTTPSMAAVAVISFIILAVPFILIFHLDAPLWTNLLTVAVILWAIVWMLYNIPIGISSDKYCIVVTHPLRRTVIPRQSVRSISRIDRGDIRGSVKFFGASGLYGHYGIFWNRKLGRYRMYIAHKDNLALITTDRRKYVVNCTDLSTLES